MRLIFDVQYREQRAVLTGPHAEVVEWLAANGLEATLIRRIIVNTAMERITVCQTCEDDEGRFYLEPGTDRIAEAIYDVPMIVPLTERLRAAGRPWWPEFKPPRLIGSLDFFELVLHPSFPDPSRGIHPIEVRVRGDIYE